MMRNHDVVSLVALSFFAVTAVAHAAPVAVNDPDQGSGDDLKHPLGAEQRAQRRAALRESISAGRVPAAQSARAARVGDSRYVELEQTRNDRVFIMLVEFGDEVHPEFPQAALGPLHNEIGEPDRTTDNATIWQPDYDPAHYLGIIRQMDEYFGWQSSGRYGLDGQATDWVRVRNGEGRYGASNRGAWPLIAEGLDGWVGGRRAAGMSDSEVRDYLQSFDVWDRYDYDGDGNFDEADGYIDHFLVVHAGEGEETGGGAQGEDAIWSHRSFVNFNQRGSAGPAGNLIGGVQIGDTGIWVGDYTIQPENGGLGVFALPVSKRSADQLLGRISRRQQHERASGRGVDSAGRCPPRSAAQARRAAVAGADPIVRCDIRPGANRLDQRAPRRCRSAAPELARRVSV